MPYTSDVQQRAGNRKPSIHVGVRLDAEAQGNLRAILDAGIADNVTDAVKCGLRAGAKIARRVIARRK